MVPLDAAVESFSFQKIIIAEDRQLIKFLSRFSPWSEKDSLG